MSLSDGAALPAAEPAHEADTAAAPVAAIAVRAVERKRLTGAMVAPFRAGRGAAVEGSCSRLESSAAFR